MNREIENKFNITNKNNKLFCINPNKGLRKIIIPPVLYEFREIDKEIKYQLVKKGDGCYWYHPISIEVNHSQLKIDIRLKEGWRIDFNQYETFRVIL